MSIVGDERNLMSSRRRLITFDFMTIPTVIWATRKQKRFQH
jgi:hypothetical protein